MGMIRGGYYNSVNVASHFIEKFPVINESPGIGMQFLFLPI
jgi:hypothetical protein